MELELIFPIFTLGLIIGVLVDEIINFCKKKYGVLKIDRSNPEKDVYRFEIDNIEKLRKKKFIVLKIDNDADLSQK